MTRAHIYYCKLLPLLKKQQQLKYDNLPKLLFFSKELDILILAGVLGQARSMPTALLKLSLL